MNRYKFSWIFSRRRLFTAVFLDYFILFLLLVSKKNIYPELDYIDKQNILFFCFIWSSLNYIFGLYFFRLNSFLLDSIKNYIKNSSKLLISFLFIYLSNSIFLKVNFLSSRDPIFSINFIVVFILSTYIGHIMLIFILHKRDSKFQNWILIGSKNLNSILSKNIHDTKYRYEIETISNINDLKKLNLKIKKYSGIIISSEFEDSIIDFSFLKSNNLSCLTIKDWCQIYIQRFPPELITASDILRINKSLNERNFEMRLKRIADIFLSSFLLIFMLPVLILSSIFIFLEDFGPILYNQIRTGFNSKKFKIYKLRSMRVNSEKEGAMWAKTNDKRISKIGKIIRSTRIDELPQLWSVLQGKMSLIGPRPERPEFDEVLNKDIPFYDTRYSIKPGLSGWAQVNYPYGASEEDAKNKLSYDLYYLENFSFFLDFLILLKTIKLVLNAKGSEQGSKI